MTHCNNCGVPLVDGDALHRCMVCMAVLCGSCALQHRKWSSELKTTDRMINREERLLREKNNKKTKHNLDDLFWPNDKKTGS